MRRLNRVYRIPATNDDGLPMLTLEDHNDEGLPMFNAPSKKKALDTGSAVSSAISGIGGIVGSFNGQSKEPKETYDFHSKENAEGFREAVKNKRILPEQVTDKDVEGEVQRHISETTIDPSDPLKSILNSPIPDYGKEHPALQTKVFTEKLKKLNNAFGSGDEAAGYLQKDIMGRPVSSIPTEELKQLAGDNVTKQTAVNRLEQQRKVEKSFQHGLGTLEEAALYNAAENGDEQVKYLLEKGGGAMAVPNIIKGEKVMQFIMNPDVQHLAQKNPELKQEINETIANLPVNHPEYAAKILAEKIARKRDEKGLNNMFANIVGKESTDKIMDELIADHELPESYRHVYAKEIRPKLGTAQSIGRGIGNSIPILNKAINEAPIPTPGLLENIQTGAENVETSLSKSIVGLAGLDMRSPEQQTYSALEKQYSQPNFEPSKWWQKATMHGGQMIPFVASLVGGGELLQGANVIKSPELASATMMALSTHGDNKEKSLTLFPGNELKQAVYTGVMDGLNASMAKFLPGKQLSKLFKDSEPVVADAIKEMVSGKITTDAAKNIILNKFATAAKGVIGGAEFTGAIAGADDLLSQTLQGKGIYFGKTVEKTWEGLKTGAVASLILGGVDATMKGNKGVQETIYDMASHPEEYKSLIKDNPQFEGLHDKILENIDYLSSVKKESDNVSSLKNESQKKKYVIDSFNEKRLTTKAEETADPTIKKQIQQEAKNIHEIKDAALKGIPEEKVKENQAIKEVKQMYNDGYLSGAAGKELETIKAEGGEGKFDEGKVVPFLKQVAEGTRKAPDNITRIAEEMFPQEDKPTTKEIGADEISEPVELNPNLPEGYQTEISKPIELNSALPIGYRMPEEIIKEENTNIPEINAHVPKEETTDIPVETKTEIGATETSNQVVEPAKEGMGGRGKEPPISAAPAIAEGDAVGITHAANEIRRKDRLLPEYEKTAQSFEQWNNEAEKTIKEGYDVEGLMDKIQEGHDPTPVENAIRKIYVATLDAEIAINPTDELLAQQKRFIETGDLANSRAGRNLVSLKGEGSPLSTISDFYVAKMQAAGVDKLTDQQKKETKEAFDNVQKADENATAAMEAYREEIAKLKAENELLKQKKATPKKTTDRVQQRKDAIEGAREALKKIRTGESGLSAVPLPGIRELIAIAPHVKKYVGSLLGEGVDNLKEVVSKTYEAFKDVLEGIAERDIHDIIAGELNERKPTRNELSAKMRDLKDEAYYINKLERLIAGTEPKSENKKVIRNQQITELKKKIKDFQKEEAAGNKFSKEELSDDVKKLQSIKRSNEKEEKEIREKITTGNFEKEKKVPFLEDSQMQKKFPKEYNAAIDAIKKKEDARHEFDISLLRDEMKRRNFGQKATDALSKAAGTVKAITTGIDDSAFAIQTYMSILRRPRTGAKAFYQHIRQGFSQKKFDRWLTALHSSADFKEMKDMGLDVTEPTSLKEREKEEIFNNRFNGTIKIKGKEYKLIDAPLKPFERAFTALGNVTRVVGYRTISAKYKREGYTPEKNPELFKSLATRLNTETGRGKVNEYVDMANKVVTMGIWSPKLMATKFNILGVSDLASLALSKAGTKGYYRQLHPKERLAAIRDVAQFATTVMALSYGFALAFGGEIDTDPLSPTFMDVKLPNGKSYNFTGGFSGYIRSISQFASGKKHEHGVEKKVNPLETAGRFFRGKVPPLTGAALNLASGKNYMGQPTSLGNEVVNLAPISVKGIVQEIQNDGAKAFFTQGIPTFFGFNVKDEKDYQKPTTQRNIRSSQSRQQRQVR